MDAGFGEDWFKEIENLQWYWLVRVRQGKVIKFNKEESWHAIKEFIPLVGNKTKNYDNCLLSKKYERPCRIITKRSFSELHKRKRPTKLPRNYNSAGKGYSAAAREPWILATNLPSNFKATDVINFYKKRMQIEQSFRDTKSYQFGLCARHVKTHCIHRWAVKMLLAAIVQITLWIIGIVAYHKGFQKVFQPNTVKNKKVFSYLFLGRLVIEHDKLKDLNIDFQHGDSIIEFELAKSW